MKNKIEKVLTDIDEITKNYKNQKVKLVAVSKKKTGQRNFKSS